jgi:hypothetical protein
MLKKQKKQNLSYRCLLPCIFHNFLPEIIKRIFDKANDKPLLGAGFFIFKFKNLLKIETAAKGVCFTET